MFNNSPDKFKFFSPDDPTGNTGKPLNSDSIFDILSAEDDDEEDIKDEGDGSSKQTKKATKEEETPTKDKGKRDSSNKELKDVITDDDDEDDEDDKDDKENEEDELDEIADELDEEEKDEDELELITPVRRKEILKIYPDLFKKFPYLEKAYYREQKYSEIFPSLDDAKAAQEDGKVLKDFEAKILSGDLSSIVSELKKEDEGAYLKLIDNYLPSLQAVDERAFFHVVNSVVKPIIYKMVERGTKNNNEELVTAARVLNEFFYGSSTWEPHKPLADGKPKEVNESEKKVQEERQALFTERFEGARNSLTEKVEKSFKKTIDRNIDLKGEMTDYVKKQATRDAYENLSSLLSKNTRFRTILDKAWRVAGESNFNADAMERIQRIINAQAKTVLPSVIRRARNEALRGIGKRVRTSKEDKEDNDTDNDSGRSASSKNRGPLKQSPSRNSGGGGKQLEIPKGMSNKDFIMSND